MLYRNLKKEDTTDVGYEDPYAFSFNMNQTRPDYIRQTDLKTGTVTESRDLYGRRFLVTQEAPSAKQWKMTTEIKLIAGYPCQKASCETEDGLVSVWFTPKIPVSVGPREFSGLPGAVLQVEFENENHLITADKIELTPLEVANLDKPTKGKAVSYEEFQKIKEEKDQEMKEMHKNGNFLMHKK